MSSSSPYVRPNNSASGGGGGGGATAISKPPPPPAASSFTTMGGYRIMTEGGGGGGSASNMRNRGSTTAAAAAAGSTTTGGAVDDYHTWNEERLAHHFAQRGLGQYATILKQHHITGPLAPLLTLSDLKDMGMTIVGDRLLMQHHLQELSRQARFQKRIQSLWEDEERLFYSDCDRSLGTCYGFCPFDPSTYKLTTNHLKVKKVRPVRCGPVRLCCCGASYVSNNIDLSKVDDVDVFGVPAPCLQRSCCCATGKDIIEVESRFEKGGKIQLVVEEGRGDLVANMILNQVEESQKMERT